MDVDVDSPDGDLARHHEFDEQGNADASDLGAAGYTHACDEVPDEDDDWDQT